MLEKGVLTFKSVFYALLTVQYTIPWDLDLILCYYCPS